MQISFNHNRLTLTFPDNLGSLEIRELSDDFDPLAQLVPLYFKGNVLVAGEKQADRVLIFHLPETIDPSEFDKQLLSGSISEAQDTLTQSYISKITPFLDKLGYSFTTTRRGDKASKTQHRFSKSLIDIPFFVAYEGATAEIYWLKRNDVLIKKGAKLKADIPLNKDGTIGFSQKFAMTLRQEHSASISEAFITTADIHLKSVNEVGHFLYFAGTNSWLILKDKSGLTLDSYTAIK